MKRQVVCAAVLLLALLRGSAHAQTGTISGTVSDAASGNGLTANVVVYSWNGAQLQSVPTNAVTGSYVVNNLPAGSYFARTVTPASSGYVDEAYRDVPCAPCPGMSTTTPINVASAGTATVDFALVTGGVISGSVSDATTSERVSGVTVEIANSVGTFAKAAVSGVSGTWAIAGLPPGTYFARTVVPATLNYLDEAYDDVPCTPCPKITTTTPVTVSGTTTTTGVDFALSAGGSIRGTVTHAITAAPIGGVVIQILNTPWSLVVKEVATDAAAVYNAGGLLPGDYRVRTQVSPPGDVIDEAYDNVPCPTCDFVAYTTPITVTQGMATTGIDFALSPGGSIGGTVTDSVTAAPVPGARVVVYTPGAFKSALSDATGAFVIRGLPPRTYTAKAFAPLELNYLDEVYCISSCVPSGTPITINGTGAISGIDFALVAGGTVTGTVIDGRTGAPAPDVRVEIYRWWWELHGRRSEAIIKTLATNVNGTYSATGIPPNSSSPPSFYSARIWRTGTHTGGSYGTIAITPGATTSGINFVLNSVGAADIVADFGSEYGLWMLSSDQHWQPLHWLSPAGMTTGDLDGNLEDDLIVNFGAGIGVYAWMNHAQWRFIHPLSPSQMVTGDLDGNQHDDLILAFPGYGIWRWVDTDSWNQLHPFDASKLAVRSGSILYVDFPGYGLWVYANATWGLVHPLSPNTMLVADVVAGFSGGIPTLGHPDLVVSFPGEGLWVFGDNQTWTRLHEVTPTVTAAGYSGLVVDFGPPYGIWKYGGYPAWTQLHQASAQSIVMADRTADAADEVIVDLGAASGLWQITNSNPDSLNQLHAVSPEDVVVGRFR